MQISLFRHKDNKVLEQFIIAQKEKAIAFLQGKFSLPSADCEDIFQEAIITLYNNIKNEKLENLTSSISTYFMGICRNKAYEFMRGKGKIITVGKATLRSVQTIGPTSPSCQCHRQPASRQSHAPHAKTWSEAGNPKVHVDTTFHPIQRF